MSKRAERRHHLAVIKEKCKKILRRWGCSLTPQNIGKTASVHGANCSCSMCCNPRKHGQLTQQEIKQNIKDKINYNETDKKE